MMNRLMCAAVAMTVAAAAGTGAPLAAHDKAAEVLQQARQALGGDKLASAKALSLEGPFRREMGQRQMQGTIALTLQLPDKMHFSEENEMPGGISIERIAVLAGETAWEDMKNRGGMGGGMQIRMVGPGGGPGAELNPEAIEKARVQRLNAQLTRYLMAFFGAANQNATWVAVAEAPDGKADVIEVKDARGQAVRLFIDQATHMPLMMQYNEVRPRIMVNDGGGRGGPGRGGFGVDGAPGGGGGGGGRGGAPAGDPNAPPPQPGGRAGADGGQRRGSIDPEEMRRRMAAMPPPAPSLVTLFLSDFKKVDGVMIPHRLVQSVDNKPVEEWTIEKAKVNPSLKADFFDKK